MNDVPCRQVGGMLSSFLNVYRILSKTFLLGVCFCVDNQYIAFESEEYHYLKYN